jgi:hypothetical protein
LRLDAANASSLTIEDGFVNAWSDPVSGRSVSATGTARPTIGDINGIPAVALDGINDIMTGSGISATAGVTLYFVVRTKVRASGRNGGVVFLSSSLSSPHFGGVSGTDQWFESFYSSTRPQISPIAITPGIYLGRITQTGSAITTEIPGLISQTSVSATFAQPTSFSVGTSIFGIFSSIDYGELILTQNPDHDRFLGFLAHKWGLTGSLPSNHPYKNSPP